MDPAKYIARAIGVVLMIAGAVNVAQWSDYDPRHMPGLGLIAIVTGFLTYAIQETER